MIASRIILLLSLAIGLPMHAVAQPQTHVSSFMHQLTIQRDTIRTRVTQWVAPISVRIPVGAGDIEILSAGMFIRQTGPGSQSVVGALDTRIKGQWALGRHMLVGLHAALPTGKSNLSPQDETLVRTIGRNDYHFPVKAFGQGLQAGGTVSLVRHSGHWTMSAGGAFVYRGAYAPVSGVQNYDPGEELSGVIGLDYTYGAWIFRSSATGAFYRTDRQSGAAVFRNGKQLLFQLGVLFAGRTFRTKIEAFEIVRFKNKDLTDGAFLFEARDSNGNDFRIQAEASWTPAPFVTFFGTGYFKHLTPNAHAPGAPLYQGEAHLLEGGGGIALSFGASHHLSLQMTRLKGKAEDDAATLSARQIRGEISVVF